MQPRILVALVLVCAAFFAGSPAAAQEADDPFESARFRFGPIRFTPAIKLTNFGTDSNIFNDAENPRRDNTAAFGPEVALWMRPAGTRLSGKFGGQYLYFQEYDNQRSWNTANEVRWEVPLARLTPFIAGTYVNSSDRQGYEIDARARRHDDSYTLGSSLRLGGKTSLVGSFTRANAVYEDDTVTDQLLATALNRRESLTEVQLRYEMTPLTTFVVATDLGRDRFVNTNVRDADSVRVMPGFELKPSALISGRVFAGYRRFKPVTDNLPEYNGAVAAVDTAYIRGATRFQARVERDIEYSFQALRPYYALTDIAVTVTQRMLTSWEIVGRGGHQILAYRQLSASGAALDDSKPDRGYVLGAGVGYRLGESLRLGVDTNYYTRRSEIEGRRDYEGLRVFGSIIYGTQQ